MPDVPRVILCVLPLVYCQCNSGPELQCCGPLHDGDVCDCARSLDSVYCNEATGFCAADPPNAQPSTAYDCVRSPAPSAPTPCVSEVSCAAAAANAGFSLGGGSCGTCGPGGAAGSWPFASSSYNNYGCYVYDDSRSSYFNRAYFGRGGNVSQMQASLVQTGSDTANHAIRVDCAVAVCSETCEYSADGDCDDGGAGAEYSQCVDEGTDCIDCGPRHVPPLPPTSPPVSIPRDEDALSIGTGDGNNVSLIVIIVLVFVLALIIPYTVSHRKICSRESQQHRRGGVSTRNLLKETSNSDMTLLRPPTCVWAPGKPDGYACFLSHYKVEAGSDARYFNDLLHRMLQCRVFLDSAELDDLRKLFTEGLHQSDVVVLLCTKGLLTRPWCLLELYEARRYGIPVIPVVMSGRGFSMKEASHFLRNLETELERENPGAIGVIQEFLDPGVTFRTFADSVMLALGMHPGVPPPNAARRALTTRKFVQSSRTMAVASVKRISKVQPPSVPPPAASPVIDEATKNWMIHDENVLHFNPFGTDNQVLADTTDIISRMAQLTGRSLRWHKPRRSKKSLEISKRASRRVSMFSRKGSARQSGSGKEYAAFISYYRDEGGPHARLLHMRLEEAIKGRVFLDATANVLSIEQIVTQGVAKSEAIVFVQTKNVLTRPWCLLELYEAIRLGVPIIPIHVADGGYDFAKAKALLEDLSKIDEVNPGGHAVLIEQLEQRELSLEDMQSTLATTLPNIIAVHFNPAGSDNHQNAVISDVVNKMQRTKAAAKSNAPVVLDYSASSKSVNSKVGSPGGVAKEGCRSVNFASIIATSSTASSSVDAVEAPADSLV